ncbi:tetratricopeptide repeat protein [Fusibacter ferrireducens]|uniref:Tetratricopeptide repeat protein n=1 Tax=Fusibacter ferrireducens TaxID=2785058 RepID=A0ABS0A037_9FIRM|nr:hypothetical protein [Fusibacter ferrireducens]MBF4696071.1 hypothetical protein [Fusibacter ferrireducens]
MNDEIIKLIIKSATIIFILIIFKKPLSHILTKLISFTFENGPKKVQAIFQGSQIHEENNFEELIEESTVYQEETWFELLLEKKFSDSFNKISEYIQTIEDSSQKIETEAIKGFILSKIDSTKIKGYFENMILNHPNNADIYIWYAKSLIGVGSEIEISKIFESGLSVASNKRQVAFSYSEFYLELHEIEKAIKILEEKLDVSFQNSEYFNKLAQLYKSKKQIDKMLEIYLNAYKLGKLESSHIAIFANELSLNKQYSEAIYLYKTLIRLDYLEATMTCLLGNQYLMLNLDDLALEAYKRAHKLSDKEAWIIANIGNLYNNKGFYSEAIEYLKLAVNIDNSSEYNSNRLSSAIKNRDAEREKEKNLLDEGIMYFK